MRSTEKPLRQRYWRLSFAEMSRNGKMRRWNDLYQLLPDTHRDGQGWEPPLPLILGAWWHTDDAQKAARLKEHIEYSAQHGALDQVAALLNHLGEADWHHEQE